MNSLCSNSSQVDTVNVVNAASDCVRGCVENASAEAHQNIAIQTIAKVVKTVRDYVARKYNQRIDRQAFNYLLTIDDDLLKDIGVTRGDILWASQLPLSEDAAKRIEDIARGRA